MQNEQIRKYTRGGGTLVVFGALFCLFVLYQLYKVFRLGIYDFDNIKAFIFLLLVGVTIIVLRIKYTINLRDKTVDRTLFLFVDVFRKTWFLDDVKFIEYGRVDLSGQAKAVAAILGRKWQLRLVTNFERIVIADFSTQEQAIREGHNLARYLNKEQRETGKEEQRV